MTGTPMRHAQLMLRALLDPGARLSFTAVDWTLMSRMARHHTVLERVTERFVAMGGAPQEMLIAAKEERSRGQTMLEILRHIHANGIKHGIAWMAPKAFARYPDVGDDVDVLVFDESTGADRLLFDGLPATRQEPSLTARVAANTLYSVGASPAPRLLFDVRHGRVGSAGQHAAFAQTLERNAKSVVLGDTEFRVPSIEDQLVLQGMEKVTGRRSFHICDVVQTTQIIRNPALDWDNVLATARAHGALDGLSCYLSYVVHVNRLLTFGGELMPARLRDRFEPGRWGYPTVRETGFYFPALQVTGRIQGRQLGRSLVHGDWDAALRLTLWPFAAITERVRRS